MKTLIATIALVAAVSVNATDYPLALSQNTIAGTVFTASGTNSPGAALSTAFDIEKAVYHTFQCVTTCTNDVTLTLYRSVDGVSWASFLTNAVSATTTNDVTMIGKWKWVAATFDGTNASVSVKYLGQ